MALAAGLIVVPRPQPAAAETLQETPVIEVTPYCFPYDSLWNITVTGHSFQANAAVNVSDWIYYTKPDDSETVTTDEYGTFTTQLTVRTNYYYYSNFIKAVYAYDTTATTVAQTYFSNCPGGPTITTLDPGCSDDAVPTIHVVGTGWAAGPSDALINFRLVGRYQGPQYGQTFSIRPAASFDVQWPLGVELPAGEYDVIISQNSEDGSVENYKQIRFVTPCPQVYVTPDCAGQAGGPPSRLTLTVGGSGFDSENEDGYADLEIVFDPDGKAQTFYYSAEDTLGGGGSFGPVDITPYARPDGTYTVEFRQNYEGDGSAVRDVKTTFRVPCYDPTIAVEGTCGPPAITGDVAKRYSLTVTGTDFAPGQLVTVVFDADQLAVGVGFPQETFTGRVGKNGLFLVPINPAFRPPGAYRILAYQDVSTGHVEASTAFTTPCRVLDPTLTVDPTCEPAAAGQTGAYTLNLTGSGFATGFVQLVFDPTGTPVSGGVQAGPRGAFEYPFVVDGRPPGAYSVVASQTTALGLLDEQTTSILVPCTGLILRITPASGPRGFVPLVEGFGFPALTTLELEWDHGIGANQPIKVQTDDNGSFSRQVMVFQHDFTGPRNMTVHNPADPTAYTDLLAPYLVVMGTVIPPFVTDNPFGAPDPIVIRR